MAQRPRTDRQQRSDKAPRTDRFVRTPSAGLVRKKAVYKGVPVVPGITIGRVHLKFRRTQLFSDDSISETQIDREIEMLAEAIRRSKEQLLVDRSKIAREIGEINATIFDSHLALLEDRGFLGKVREQVRSQLKPVEVVVSVIVEGYYRTMSMVHDEVLRERAADIRDVGLRLLDNLFALKQRGRPSNEPNIGLIGAGDIIFARELLPSDIATLEARHVGGVITEAGSARGHCAVMLRAMNIPTVMGITDIADVINDGDLVIIDGSAGSVILNPRKDVLESYQKTQAEFESYKSLLQSEVLLPATTTDGHSLSLLANISKRSELDLAQMFNIDGIGLYRTEFQLMVREDFPDEEEQYQLYRDVVRAAAGKPVTIRTMDIGADKHLSYFKTSGHDHSSLGRRSIRLALDELQDFQLSQLRAILRAGRDGPIQLMFPFITSVEDIRMAKRLVRQAQRQIEERGGKAVPEIPIGMMVEIPAAALSLDKFAREVSFFSVGTNDLIQYVCAADRNLAEVAAWYKGYNPGVLALLKQIVDTARAHDRPLTICGEMAGDPFYTMFLVGLGVTRLSMSAPNVPLVKKIIRSTHLDGARRLVDRALQLSSTNQIRELFQSTVERILGRDLTAWTKQDAT